MNNQQQIFELLKQLTGQNNILTVPRHFIELTGSINGALFLSQLIYWSGRYDDGWFYKSHDDWKKDIYLSKDQVSQLSKKFKELGILETKLKKINGAPTKHYRILFSAFTKWIVENLDNHGSSEISQVESGESRKSYNEHRLHTETTTEREIKKSARARERADLSLVEHPSGKGEQGGSPPLYSADPPPSVNALVEKLKWMKGKVGENANGEFSPFGPVYRNLEIWLQNGLDPEEIEKNYGHYLMSKEEWFVGHPFHLFVKHYDRIEAKRKQRKGKIFDDKKSFSPYEEKTRHIPRH